MTENFSGVFMGSPMVTIRVVGSRDPRDPMVDPPLCGWIADKCAYYRILCDFEFVGSTSTIIVWLDC
jgi:hypothetical protein